MRNFIYFLFAFLPLHLAAHGGDDHSHEKEKAAVTLNYFSAEASSDKYEVLLRYSPIHPGEAGTFKIFLSDFKTNRATDSAKLVLSSPDDPNLRFEIHNDEPGIYSVKTLFPAKKNYRINVKIDSPLGADLLAVTGIDVGKELEQEEEASKDWKDNPWLLFGLGLGGGLLLMFLLMKAGRKTKALTLLIAFLPGLFPFGPQTLNAHGEEDSGAKSTNLSNAIYVPKETQFLFDMYTRKMETGDFTESVSLYGTVIPSSNGQALVQPSQSGKIYSLNVNVGQRVTKGQLLAIFEPSIDAASLVNFAAERNSVIAEYEAAKKEYDRLQTLKDIVAKQDIDEADARLKKAAENKKLFEGLAGGSVDASRLVYLRSPIDGIVENFTLSIGTTVTAGETIFTVTNLSKVYIEAQVFDKDVDKVMNGGRFTAECTDDNHQSGEVHLLSMAQSINPTNQSQRVFFEMDNPGGEFKIGEFVNVSVFAKEASRKIAVPNSAISEINGRPVVFIKDAAEQYSISFIQPGEDNGSFTVVLKGVEENERIVVNATYQAKMIYLNQ
jgi:RND family efflux transporter MFP subunit